MLPPLVKNSFCSYCGHPYSDKDKLGPWPRKCLGCKTESYSNPIPVAVAIIPVYLDKKWGMIIQQRNHDPKKGEWALTGGYMEDGETWQQTISREIEEELGLNMPASDFTLSNVEHSTNRSQILIIGIGKAILSFKDIKFSLSSEVQDVKIIYEEMELAFPSHTDAVKKFFYKPEIKKPDTESITIDPINWSYRDLF